MQVEVIAASQFTRPANTTQYASGDLVANSTTAVLVAPLTFTLVPGAAGQVRRVKLFKSDTGVTTASFRLHLYATSPTVANGDNGAWSSTHSGWIGSLDVTVDKAFSNGAAGVGGMASGHGTEINFNNPVLWGLLEARGTYTPASAETFDVSIEVVR